MTAVAANAARIVLYAFIDASSLLVAPSYGGREVVTNRSSAHALEVDNQAPGFAKRDRQNSTARASSEDMQISERWLPLVLSHATATT